VTTVVGAMTQLAGSRDAIDTRSSASEAFVLPVVRREDGEWMGVPCDLPTQCRETVAVDHGGKRGLTHHPLHGGRRCGIGAEAWADDESLEAVESFEHGSIPPGLWQLDTHDLDRRVIAEVAARTAEADVARARALRAARCQRGGAVHPF